MEDQNKQQKITEAVEFFLKLLPIIPTVLTVIGAAKLYAQYRIVGINIFNYLDLQELLLLFVNDLYVVLFSTFGITVLQTFTDVRRSDQYNYEEERKKFWFTRIVHYGINILLYGSIFCLLIFNLEPDWFSERGKTILVGCFIGSSFSKVAELNQSFRRTTVTFQNYYSGLTCQFYATVCLFAAFVGSSSLVRFNVFGEHVFEDVAIGNSIQLKDQDITINNRNLLVGTTRNYLFIYTTSDKCTTVYRNSDIQSLSTKLTEGFTRPFGPHR